MHDGRLGVSPRSVCLFHRRPDDGRVLLDALAEAEAGAPYRRTATLAASSRPGAVRTVRFEIAEPTIEMKAMHAACAGETCVIRLTAEGAAAFRSSLNAWFDGGEDFGCGPRQADVPAETLGEADRASAEVWFWGPHYSGP